MLWVDTMGRIAAGTIVTNNQTMWHRPAMKSPGYLVRSDNLFSNSKPPIARDNHRRPQPTALCFVDFGPKARLKPAGLALALIITNGFYHSDHVFTRQAYPRSDGGRTEAFSR